MNIDKSIIQSISEGDKNSFEKLYNLFNEKVYNTAISYVQDSNEAEEITQDVFIKIYKYASNFKGDSSVSTWIYRITVNTSLNYVKKQKKNKLTVFNNEDYNKSDFIHPGVLLENQESSAYLFAAIDKLPETQKTAFILSFVEELPRQEVAEVMETSLKAVESLLQRGKANLRKELEKMYPNRMKKKK